MKGRRLYHLLKEISTKDRKKLIHLLQFTKDKRALIFEDILKNDFKNNKDLDEYLNNRFVEKNNNKSTIEIDKSIRRFVDYANKYLEDLLINNHLQLNKVDRMRILNEIVADGKNDYLQDYYLSKTIIQAKKNKDVNLHNQYLDWQINRYGRQQHDKNIKHIKKLLSEKKLYLNFAHHEQLSFYYRLLSTTLIDESISDDNKVISPSPTELDELVAKSLNKFYSGDYMITKARFSFFQDDFEELINDAITYIQNIPIKPIEKKVLTRRALFLKMVHNFNVDKPLNELLSYSKQIIDFNIALGFRDGLSFFYHLLFLVLNNDIDQCEKELEENTSLFFNDKTLFYASFIEGLIALKKNKKDNTHFDEALGIFSELKYSPNYYISLWSSLYEFLIHYLQGNMMLCKSLIERLKTFLYQHNHMEYSYEASNYVYAVFRKLLSKRLLNKEKPVLSALHKFILEFVE